MLLPASVDCTPLIHSTPALDSPYVLPQMAKLC